MRLRTAGLALGLGFVLPGFMLGALPALAATGSAALEMAKKRVESADFRAVGRFVTVDAAGKRTNYPMTLKGRWLQGALRLVCVISGPPEARERVWMVMWPDGRSSVKVAKAGDKAPVVVPAAKLGERVVGAFSYEDLMEAQFFWGNQTVIGQVKYGARECDLIRSVPGADQSEYAEVKTWLDRTIGFPVHAEKTEKRGGAVKEFTYYGLRQTEGVWSASQVEVKTGAQGGETLLVIERGSAHAHVGPEEFNPDPAAP